MSAKKEYVMHVTIALVIDGPQAEQTRDALEVAIRQYGSVAASVGAWGGVHVKKACRDMTGDETDRKALREAFAPLCTDADKMAETEEYITGILQTRQSEAYGKAADEVEALAAKLTSKGGHDLN